MSPAENSLSPAGTPVPTGSLTPCVGPQASRQMHGAGTKAHASAPRGDLLEPTRSKICFFLRQHAFPGLSKSGRPAQL